jgi:hypothetical protein
MSLPRRRILRPIPPPSENGRRPHLLAARRSRLAAEQQNLARWMSRLKRAFHAVEKNQARVCRLEREIARLEQG